MLAGARQGKLSGWRRLVAAAMARDLNVFLVPGPDIARAHGLDIEAAGLQLVVSPRHASVLLVIGAIPPALREAATVVYAQMMRPRALFVLGAEDLSPLPPADVIAGLSQQDLVQGVHQLRTVFAGGAFYPDVSDFDAPVLQIRIEYTCPMHPEVVQDEPGSCPKCGMTLMPREAQASTEHAHAEHNETDANTDMQAVSTHENNSHPGMAHDAGVEYTCPMHPEVVQSDPGSCPKCGMHLEPRDIQTEAAHEHHDMAHDAAVEYTCPMHPEIVQSEPGSCPKCGMHLEPRDIQTEAAHEHHGMNHDAAVEYTCPMHPEIVQSEPGSCPKCGMHLEPRDIQTEATHEHAGMNSGSDHAGMDHSSMDHGDMAFMSMIDVTRDLPRSSDGLPMEWIEAPFGPFFPGLPGGLLLTLTLDGDAVAGSDARSLTGNINLLHPLPTHATHFVEQLAGLDPLAPLSYRLLACQALENTARIEVSADTARARAGALERERITSHLGWLALFGQQNGFTWLLRCAASLQLKFQHADLRQIMALKPDVKILVKRLQRTPLLKPRTAGIARLAHDAALRGPVARASGISGDARSSDKTFTALGFTPASRKEGDAFARLQVRLDEITHSLALIKAAGSIELPALADIGDVSGTGEALVETPRGMARLQLTLEMGQVIAAQLDTPSTHHLTLIAPLIEQQELGDALVAVGSLDLSPWEMRQ